MSSERHNHPSRVTARSERLRRWVGWLVLVLVLAGFAVVAVQVGWAGWLLRHPGQAWQWVQQRWFSTAATAVLVALFVGLLTVAVTLAVGHRQVHSAERLAAQQQAREDEQAAREQEHVAEERQAAWEQRCRSLLVYWPLPKVAEADPYQLGVFYSRRADVYRADRPRPPYVPRAIDAELAELLRLQPLVLVKGQSRAGKSRTAFEAVAQEFGDWRLLVPLDRAALAALVELDPLPGQGEQMLIWLDDLDRYLTVEGAIGLTTSLLGRLAACDPPAKVVATMRLEEYGRLVETRGELGRAVRAMLNRFEPGALMLPVEFDDPIEQAAIASLYPGEEFVGGLAEHFAAVPELINRLDVGRAGIPEGAGVVLAAADWRRGGMKRPISKQDLVSILPTYVEQLRPRAPMQTGDLERGLEWGTALIGRTASLLVTHREPSVGLYDAVDSIVDHLERRHGRKLTNARMWKVLLSHASQEEAMNIAFAAYTRREFTVAQEAWEQVADSDYPMAYQAALNLGLLFTDQGNTVRAKDAFQTAINSSPADVARRAALMLTMLLSGKGDTAGAKAAYQQATALGHTGETIRVAVRLGDRLAKHGDTTGAKHAYQEAINSGRIDAAPQAALSLGLLLVDEGDNLGAKAAFLQVIDTGDPALKPLAAYNLGVLLTLRDDLSGARAAYELAVQSANAAGDATLSTAAQKALQELERA